MAIERNIFLAHNYNAKIIAKKWRTLQKIKSFFQKLVGELSNFKAYSKSTQLEGNWWCKVIKKNCNSNQGLSKPMWYDHFALGVMLTFVQMCQSHPQIMHELPPLCMAIENIFGHHKIGDKN
jgi:hypothetical protein